MSKLNKNNIYTGGDYVYGRSSEYEREILDELNIKYIKSFIDYSNIIKIKSTDYNTENILGIFFDYSRINSLNEHITTLTSFDKKYNINNGEYYIKINYFSNYNWKEYKKIIRKQKINRIECQKFS